MASLRTGSYGSYYGSTTENSEPLTSEQMQLNAKYVGKYLTAHGWTLNAICGMLGNMQAESTINPGRWQSDNVGNTSGGYGLVQWTPATNYLNWCDSEGISDPSEMDHNLDRIMYELENNLQWIATSTYNFSFKQFSESKESVEYLASAFLKCYERAGVEVEETRRSNASEWYTYLTNEDIVGGGGSSGSESNKKKKKFNFILFRKNNRGIRV